MANRVAAEKAFQSIENVLGGKDVLGVKPQSSVDWVGIIRAGIPAAAVESVLSTMHVSQTELAQALGIPQRTLARRKREICLGSFLLATSEQLVRRDRQFTYALAGRLEYGIRDRRRDAHHRDLADALHAERVHVRVVLVDEDHVHHPRAVGVDR